MKTKMLFFLLFVVVVMGRFAQGQTNNYVAKFLNGTLTNSSIVAVNGNVGIGTKTPTQRFSVNFGDVLASGYQNFAANGNLAHYYVGDINHAVGAVRGAGMFFSTYLQPSAMVITDNITTSYGGTSAKVGIDNTKPDAMLTVGGAYCPYYDLSCSFFLDVGQGALTVDNFGRVSISGGLISTSNLHAQMAAVNGDLYITGLTVAGQGITFPDGTVQTTACTPATVAAATTVKRSVRKVRK